jgi:hypothetical protein
MEKLSRWYGTTKLGVALPLTSPVIRSIALHIWDAAGLTGQGGDNSLNLKMGTSFVRKNT